MLRIRQFILGKDEQVWINILNEAFKEYENLRPQTLEDMETWQKEPLFDDIGMFIAEFDGKPVGCFNTFIDGEKKEKKGFIDDLGIVPEYRGRGIGRHLLKRALESLKERGMERVEVEIQDDKITAKKLFESMSFRQVRVYSRMIIDLSNIPSGIGENKEITIKIVNKNSEEDIELFTLLLNESFKEHYNYRPRTVEEIRFWFQQNPIWNDTEYFIPYLQNKPVGFIGVGIDTKYNKHWKKKAGYILTIGSIKHYRKQGIGKTLMLHGLNFLKSKGMEVAELDVDDSNPTRAIELYKRVGFRVHFKKLIYQKELD